MGVGPLASIMPLLSLGSKLFAGGGGAQAGAAPAAPGPFDAITQGAPMGGGMQPPMPQQNPAFAEDRSLFSGAEANTMPLPQRGPRAEFDRESQGLFPSLAPKPPMPGRGAVPIPERGARMSPDDMAQGPAGEEYGLFMDAQAADDEEKAAKGLFSMEPTSATAPINSTDTRSNAQRYKDAGYTLDSRVAETVQPKSAPKPAKPAKVNNAPLAVEDDVDTGNGTEVKSDTVSRTTPSLPDRSATGDMDEEGDEYSTGEGLFGEQMGGYLGDIQDKLGDSATNPLFQVGLGLLASGYDGSNPYAMMGRNLSAIPGYQIAGQAADLGVNADTRAGRADARAERDQARQDREAALREEQMTLLLKQLGMLEGVQKPGSNVARGSAKVIK